MLASRCPRLIHNLNQPHTAACWAFAPRRPPQGGCPPLAARRAISARMGRARARRPPARAARNTPPPLAYARRIEKILLVEGVEKAALPPTGVLFEHGKEGRQANSLA